MATAATMQGIWGMLETLSLTSRNKRWLADKLIVSIPAKAKAATTPAKEAVARLSAETGAKYSKEDQRKLEGFYEAIQELKDIKAGRSQAVPHDEAMAQLRRELEEEGYALD